MHSSPSNALSEFLFCCVKCVSIAVVRAVLTEKTISICLSSLLDFISQKKKINTERENEGKIEHFHSICFFVFTYFSAPVHFLLLSASLSPNVFFIINVSVLSVSLSLSLCECLRWAHLNSFIFLFVL